MSESGTSRTKTLTDDGDTDSNLTQHNPDRWSNNISYRQLIISSCIGTFQIWYHPYVHDLTRLLPFLFIYNVLSIVFGYPLFYLELALGVITKKGVVNCWDLAPLARGVGLSMLIVCAWSALSASLVAAWSLALLVHSFHSFLPWLHCAAAVNTPCAARHRPLPPGSDTPAQSFFLNYVLELKRDGLECGLGTIVRELSVYFVISWLLIYCITIKRIYSISKLVLFKDVLAYFMILCCALGAYRLQGSTRMFNEATWSILLTDIQIWREAIEYVLIQLTLSQGVLVMLGMYCPKQQHPLARTALFAFATSKSSSMVVAFTLGAAHGALYHDYQNNANLWNGTATSMILWSDFVARIPGSQFWSALMFFSLFLLSLTSTALLVQTIMSTLSGHSIRKIRWVFLVMMCSLFALIGVLTLCTQGGLYLMDFIMKWPASKPRVPIAGVMTAVITFVYGQTTFCEDVYFAVGEYPCVFLRVCWAVIPVILLVTFLMGFFSWPHYATMGWALVTITILPMLIIMLFYLIFKFRVRNIVHTEK